MRAETLTSSTLPDVLSFQQKWMRESSVCWTYTRPFRLSGVTVVPFNDIFPARNSTKYLLEDPREPGTRLGNRAPEVVILQRGPACRPGHCHRSPNSKVALAAERKALPVPLGDHAPRRRRPNTCFEASRGHRGWRCLRQRGRCAGRHGSCFSCFPENDSNPRIQAHRRRRGAPASGPPPCP